MLETTPTHYPDHTAGETAATTRICITVGEKTVESLVSAINEAQPAADLIEIRLDCLERSELDSFVSNLNAHLAPPARPVLLTLRSHKQDDIADAFRDEAERRAFWSRHLSPEKHRAAFVDIELDHAEELVVLEKRGEKTVDWSRVICSYHSVHSAPTDLEEIYARLMQLPARFIRIGISTNCVTDCVIVFKILDRARSQMRAIITAATGRGALPSLVLGPSYGSWLTFASLDNANNRAAYQMTAETLRTLYRVDQITKKTQLFAVVENPGSQSIAPHVHNSAFVASGLDAVCLPFEPTDILKFIRRMVRTSTREIEWNLCGFNVMEPFKTRIPTGLHWVDDIAKEIGAVNTVSIVNDLMCGYNTDTAGALIPLEFLINLRTARIAVIGVGGTALALLWTLRNAGADTTLLVAKTENCRELAKKYQTRAEVLDGGSLSSFDVVINATSIGSAGPTLNTTPVLAKQLRGVRIAYDLVYNPIDTRFLQEARAAGCEAMVNGLVRFLARASAEFKIWTGLEAPEANMRSAAIAALNLSSVSPSNSASEAAGA